VRFTCVQADINLKEVTINSATGDYNPTSLANIINIETLNSLVLQTWLDKSGARVSPLARLRVLTLVEQVIALGSSRKCFTRRGLTNVFSLGAGALECTYLAPRVPGRGNPVLANCGSLSLPSHYRHKFDVLK
jgi:hypothetical protein